MKELKSLEEEARFIITCQCLKGNYKTKQTKKLKKIFNEINRNGLPLNEMWVFINSAGKAMREGVGGFYVSLDNNTLTAINRGKTNKLCAKRVIYLLSYLEEEGYVEVFKGFYSEGISFRTCVLLTGKTKSIFSGVKVDIPEDKQTEYLVEIKDDKGVVMNNTRGFSGIKEVKTFVKDFNSFILEQDVRFKDTKCAVAYKRVFNGDLQSGGRFYSQGGFQSVRSERRKDLRINGNKTTEVDFVSIHPRLIATLHGVILPYGYDPYSFDVGGVGRSFNKIVMMCALYSNTRAGAVSAVVLKLKAQHIFKKGLAKDLIQGLERHNKWIVPSLYNKDKWKELQNLDSQIASAVLQRLKSIGVAALPWHDSFVVEVQYRDLLMRAMEEAWHSLFGSGLNFKVKVEF